MEDVNFQWYTPAIDLANNIELPQFKLKGTYNSFHGKLSKSLLKSEGIILLG